MVAAEPRTTRGRENKGVLRNVDFAKVVREQSNRVYNTVYCLLGNETDAEDVAQEVFLRAYQAIDGFKGKSNISTWLYRITVNVVYDHIKKNNRNEQLREPLDIEELETIGNALRAHENPEASFFKKELNETIQKALSGIPYNFRTVFVLKEIEGYSYRDIGKILGLSIGTVESRLFRAREMLRRNLANLTEKTGDSIEAM
jgi:RNA polymerase sigma-70 factor, ECF subfamily